jgi:hypothetical protein
VAICRESCQSPRGVTSGSRGRRDADDGHSSRLLTISSGRHDPPNGFAFEKLSICSAENLSSDGEGEPSPECREIAGQRSG